MHAAPYSAESRDKDNTAYGIYNHHGYRIGSLSQYGGYGRHRAG